MVDGTRPEPDRSRPGKATRIGAEYSPDASDAGMGESEGAMNVLYFLAGMVGMVVGLALIVVGATFICVSIDLMFLKR